ncbi:MAG TPA: 4'-phosphopantetheinyl transferase superfamily protein [Candidatus Acidoferrales bacterium]|nr:4'-phosphopantetheinyl transferase superfamily protein [Candidatus Acidoferrales bacterium]
MTVASTLLARLFTAPVAAYELRGAANAATLLPEEAGTCRAWRPKRLEEFAAGRVCARRALADLGVSGFALRRNADRTAAWPDHIVGSISHTVGFCGAVAAPRTQFASIGIDVEVVTRVTPDLWAQILTPREIAQLERLDVVGRERIAAILFSAKEAFYKCQYRITEAWLDYRDVSLDLCAQEPRGGSFIVRAATPNARAILGELTAQGTYRLEGTLVATGIALTRDAAELLKPYRTMAIT